MHNFIITKSFTYKFQTAIKATASNPKERIWKPTNTICPSHLKHNDGKNVAKLLSGSIALKTSFQNS